MNRKDDPSKSAAERGKKSTVLGVGVNLGLAFTKCSAGILGNSFALVADGLESLTDVFSGLVVYYGLKIAVKPPDSDHPYGHGKAEPIAAAVVSLALMAAAVGIVYEGIREITRPHGAPAPYTLVVLAGVLIAKELLYRHVQSVGASIGSLAVKSDAWHHRSDALTSAFAFVGISIALLGGPGWEVADGWAALCAAGVILFNALKLLRPAIRELGDIAPDTGVEAQVRAIAERVPGVIGLDKCFVRKMGFTFYVDLHVVVAGEMTVREGHRLSHKVEDEVLKELPQVAEVLVHVEPEEELASKGNRKRVGP
ncbi:MAG TPA: cation diffusion facilitator family transporter [Terriglobia bacterium]|nr:cation diffusion facilitator family transporter [Terriglobia bacterium]